MAMIEHAARDHFDRLGDRRGRYDDGLAPDEPDFLELREVVHDIRQPLAAMRSIAAELRLRFDEPLLSDRLHLLESQISLVDDLIGSIAPRPSRTSSVDLAAVTQRAVSMFRQLHPTTALSTSVRPALVNNIDGLTWWRVVQNLLDNASRAAGPAGHVELSLRSYDGAIELRVDDDGHAGFGMLPSGESLGLRFVIRTIHTQRGRISLEALPDGGTSVVATIPAHYVALDHVTRSS